MNFKYKSLEIESGAKKSYEKQEQLKFINNFSVNAVEMKMKRKKQKSFYGFSLFAIFHGAHIPPFTYEMLLFLISKLSRVRNNKNQ